MPRKKMFSFPSGVYRIRNVVTNDFYIGSTTKLVDRKYDHFFKLRTGTHINKRLQEAFDKYGEVNFLFEVLIFCSENRLKYYEKRLTHTMHPTYNIRIWENERLKNIRDPKITKGMLVSYSRKRTNRERYSKITDETNYF